MKRSACCLGTGFRVAWPRLGPTSPHRWPEPRLWTAFQIRAIATERFVNFFTRVRSGYYQYHTTKFSYYPYGEEYTTTPQEREKFGTYYRDGSTGLDYAQNRYYASTYARFMTADPYGGQRSYGSGAVEQLRIRRE